MKMSKQESSTAEEEQVQAPRPHKNHYEFSFDKGRNIIISSNFDSGNIALVKQLS